MKKGMLAALLCLILLSGCGGKPEPIPLEELPQDYSLERAKDDGCLVTEDGDRHQRTGELGGFFRSC